MKIYKIKLILFGIAAALTAARLQAEPSASDPVYKNLPSLWPVYETLASRKFVDLTHDFHPGIPHWKGYPDQEVTTLYDYNRDGFKALRYDIVGQWGTHADAPSHFHQDLRSLDEISVHEMVAPLVVINISSKSRSNPDYALKPEDIKKWESLYGKIPDRAFVALRTDWSQRWPSIEAMQNADSRGAFHYPGWSVEALKFLVEERNIVAIGHETTDTDKGKDVFQDRYPAQAYIHGKNRYQIELLTNLDKLPAKGALIIATFPKPEGGTGFPARVFAILP